jgi:hypothetical protein
MTRVQPLIGPWGSAQPRAETLSQSGSESRNRHAARRTLEQPDDPVVPQPFHARSVRNFEVLVRYAFVYSFL